MRSLGPRRFNSALVPFVLSLVRAKGADASRLEKRYLRGGLPEVSLPELGALLTDASKLLKDPLFGLHCAQAMPRGSYGLLEFGLRAAPTLRLAMEQLATYGALINPLVRWTVEEEGAALSLHHRAPKRGGVGAQANIFTVARIVHIAREMVGDELAPVRAWFAHDARSAPPELATFLGTGRLSFGRASNGFTLSAKDLARRPRAADPELNRALELHGAAVLKASGDADDVYERTRAVVLQLLPKREATLEQTARRLHVTARTLQRRLLEHDVSFAGLLAEARRSQAERLLHGEATMEQIAEALGYADAGVFVRAFRSWTGQTPGKFRQAQRAA